LTDHPLVIFAARSGAAFGQDPITILRGDEFDLLVRQAAYQVWAADEKARNEAMNK